MGQSTPPRHGQRPKPASVLKPFGDIGIPALAAAAHAAARQPKKAPPTHDVPWLLRKEKFVD